MPYLHDSMKALLQNLVKLQSLETGVKDKSVETSVAQLRSQIPPPILGHYDRLVARGKKGLAAVHGQVCSGCHMQVPLGVVLTLQHGQDLQLCENCGRYLYLLPAEAGATAEPVPDPKPAKKGRKPRKSLQTV